MKKNILKLLVALGMVATSQAAVTFTFLTQTGSANGPNGLPVVDAAGAAILNSTNSLFASIGYLSPIVDPINDITPAGTLARFNAVDNTPITPNLLIGGATPRNGLFNAQDYNSATNVYPAGFQGKQAVVFIGNNAVIKDSDAIAMFTFGNFAAPDGLGNNVQSFALTALSVPTIGILTPVTSQPSAGNTYVNGVQLVSLVPIPETSTSLLGALGALALLRRRRN
jgi:hypothetical protein